MENSKDNKMAIKSFYYYLVSFASLIMIVISSIVIIYTVLKMTVLQQADYRSGYYSYTSGCFGQPINASEVKPTPEFCAEEKKRQMEEEEHRIVYERQSNLAGSIAVFVVALPLFIIHWNLARKKE